MRRLGKRLWMIGVAAALALTALTACGGDDDQQAGGAGATGQSRGDTIALIQERGLLNCGVTDTLPGFGFRSPDGSYSGFDVEFCKALAAAVLEDASKIEFVPASSQARFELLAAGQVDVLVRVTTITAQRDSARGVDFAQTTFYDGQGFVVHADSPIQAAEDMDGATICVAAGTTTEQNLDDFFNERGMRYTPLPGEGSEPQDQFVARRCDVYTSDKSGLAARVAALPNSEDFRFLPLTISKEPLAPGVRDYDSDWKDVVNWVVFGLINAEELGVNSGNVDAWAANPPNTAVARLLGVPFEGGEVADLGFKVDPQFVQRALRAVGNYGEIYERTVAQLGIEREGTLNALYTEGGILYAPPYR